MPMDDPRDELHDREDAVVESEDEAVETSTELDVTQLPSSYGPTHPLYQVGSTVASTAVCAIVVMQLLLAMLAVVLFGPLVAAVFDRLGEPLPRLTTWVLAVPPTAVFVLMVLLIIAVIAKEVIMANKVLTLAINGAFVLASLVWMPLLVRALYTPLVELTRSLD